MGVAERWAGELAARGRPARYGDASVAPELLAWAQQLPYEVRSEGAMDFVDEVLETVEVLGGDCKARSQYLVALCRWHGLGAGLVWVPQGGFPVDHVSAWIWWRGRWVWADATVPGAELGEAPEDAARRVSRAGMQARGIHAG